MHPDVAEEQRKPPMISGVYVKSYDELLRAVYPDSPRYALVYKPNTWRQRARWRLIAIADWLHLGWLVRL